MAADPEAIYSEVLAEEQQKGTTPAAAEARAKAARARAEHGSPHPKEPKWWPGAQPHLEGGGGEAPTEEIEEPATEEVEEAPAAEAAPPPAEETPAAQPPDLGEQEAPAAAAPAPQPAAVTAPQPAAAAPVAAATATELPPDQRPAGVTHGTPSGNRLRPEDSVGTETQFDAQQAMYRRRKMIDELVQTGVPAATAASANRASSASPFALLIYIVIFALAVGFLVANKDNLAAAEGGGGEETEAPVEGGITAANVEFNTDTLEFTAGEESELPFTNEDTVPHNVSIYQEEGGENLFKGETVQGGGSTTYAIPALEAGNFYFQCDLHPAMNGDVTVK